VYNEQALIAAFVKRGKRDRYWEILSNPRLRHKFANQLAHFTDFDPKYRLPIPSNKLFVENIARAIKVWPSVSGCILGEDEVAGSFRVAGGAGFEQRLVARFTVFVEVSEAPSARRGVFP
jgi:hypothetical protein